MATSDNPYGDAETAEQVMARLAAMQRAAAAAGTSWSGSDVNPTNDSARPDMGTVAATTPTPTSSWSGSDTNQANSSWAPSTDQLDAMRRAIADSAAQNAAYKTQPTGSSSGSDLNPTNSSAIGDTSAIQRALAGGTSTGQSDLSTAATGGSVSSAPKVQPPTTIPTTTTDPNAPNAANLAYTQASAGTDAATRAAGAGAGTADTSALARAAGAAAGAGTGAGPSGAGSSTIDTSAGAGAGSGGQSLGALTNSIVSQLQGIGQSVSAPGNAPDVGAVFMNQANSILAMLDEQEKQIRAEAEKNGTTIDPATQFTLDKIREGLEENLKTTREDMNRRGIYDSGISLDLESKLKKGSASDQAMILSSRLSKLQDQLSQGLSSIRSQKVSTLSSFGRDAAQAGFTAGENAKRQAYDAEQAKLQGMLNLRNQVSGEQNAAANRSFQGQESALDRSFRSSESALERAYGEAQSKAQTAAQFEANRLAYEREKALVDERASSGAGGAGGTTRASGTTRTTQAAQGTGDITDQAVAELKDTFTNANDANAAIKENLKELAEAGVDIAKLYNAASGLGGRRVGTAGY